MLRKGGVTQRHRAAKLMLGGVGGLAPVAVAALAVARAFAALLPQKVECARRNSPSSADRRRVAESRDCREKESRPLAAELPRLRQEDANSREVAMETRRESHSWDAAEARSGSAEATSMSDAFISRARSAA